MIQSPQGQAATFTSALPEFRKALAEQTNKALEAAGETYRSAIEARLRTGYKSGTFVTGKVAGSVKVSEVKNLNGIPTIHVYTKDFKARLWEFGHTNKWTRQYERVRAWYETAMAQKQNVAASMLDSYRAMRTFWNPHWKPGQGRSHLRRKR